MVDRYRIARCSLCIARLSNQSCIRDHHHHHRPHPAPADLFLVFSPEARPLRTEGHHPPLSPRLRVKIALSGFPARSTTTPSAAWNSALISVPPRRRNILISPPPAPAARVALLGWSILSAPAPPALPPSRCG